MKIYEFTLEIHDGTNQYTDKQLVLAADDRAAARFAREFADHWRPNAMHDHELDLYFDPVGSPQWNLAHCAAISYLTIPVAGKRAPMRMALFPIQESFATGLTLVADILHSLGDPSVADCSLRWVLSDQLNLSAKSVANTMKVIQELRQWIGECSEPSMDEQAKRMP